MTLTTAPGTGVINITSNPPGALVYIDDMEYNPTPVTINNIPTGTHSFKVTLEGYDDFTDSAEVIEDKMCCESINLVEKTSGVVCNPQAIEIKETTVTPPVTPPGGGGSGGSSEISQGEFIIIGILIGIGLMLGYQHFHKEKK
jgi:hypothetical protein